MKKYEEEHYQLEKIKDSIYPWVKEELIDTHALNGKNISEKDTPVIAFVGELKIIFVIKRGEDTFEILRDNMLPPECDIVELYHTACENLVRDVEYVIANTWYGAFAIVADGYHEASALCFKHIWQICVDKLKEDLLIIAPTKDMILFAAVGNQDVIDKMKDHASQAYEQSTDKVSMQLMQFSKDRKELTLYEEM